MLRSGRVLKALSGAASSLVLLTTAAAAVPVWAILSAAEVLH